VVAEAIFFMKDLRRFLERPEIVRKLEDLAPQFTMDRRVIVLLAAKDALPAELQPLAAPYTFALPTAVELKAVAKALVNRIRKGGFAFEPAAKEFGLEVPKGILLLGVQGAGKTLVAKAVAREWALSLLKMEPGRLYDKYVGESDKNLEKALHMAEAMVAC
jgi:ATP-dependent protease Clp ATPase subunit